MYIVNCNIIDIVNMIASPSTVVERH